MISPSASEPTEDRSLRLPVHGNTIAAEDLKVRLVLAADLDEQMKARTRFVPDRARSLRRPKILRAAPRAMRPAWKKHPPP